MHTTIRATVSCLPVLFALGWAAQAMAQSEPAPAPTYYTPGAPSAEPTAPLPADGMAPAPATEMAPAPAAQGEATAGWSFSSGFDSSATGMAAAPKAETMTDEEKYNWRVESLKLHNNLYGSTGLLRLSDAGSGVAGTFRVALITEWFTAKGFLCTEDRPCGAGRTEDKASHFGTTASLSVTPLSFLEVFASFRSYANSNDQGRPKLLQVLGDSILGFKAFTPAEPDRFFRFGGEAQLLLLNGTGGVGLDGGGTGFRLRGLSTLDFTGLESPLPLRVYGNVGYHVDNSGKIVADTEEARGDLPITRIERFGLGINRTDSFELGLGVEGVFEYARPFLSYTIDLPLNRQDYTCHKSKATTQAFHDACLGENQTMAYMPSRLTLGARGYPILKGLAPIAALDIGITGKRDFLEEVSPQAPWTLYIGVGYAADVVEAEPIVKTELVEKLVEAPTPAVNIVRGKVIEKGENTPVTNAIILVQSSAVGGYSTGPEGIFETRSVEPGTYTFIVSAEGYKPGQCTAQVTSPTQPAYGTDPQAGTYGQAQGYDAQTGLYGTAGYGAPAGGYGTPAPQAAPSGPVYTDIVCELEALPKMGNVTGTTLDSSSNAPVSGANILVTDSLGKEYRTTTGNDGTFRIDGVNPGDVKVHVESERYLLNNESTTVEPRKDAQLVINLNPRPKQANVLVTQTQIIIKKQINFETDSSVIKGDSTALLQEIADVIVRNPSIKLVEVQGHTDNTGTRDHNQELSERRANAVKDWLTTNGIQASRIEANGYGQTRPIAPNVTAANRARNRRVQFVIKERD